MKNIVVLLLAVFILLTMSCSKNDTTSAGESSSTIENAPQNQENATIDYNPAKVLHDSVFDLEFFEDDRIFTWRNAKIIDIKIADETFDIDKGVVAGMQMDYVIYFDSPDDKVKQSALYVNKKDTRVFKIVNDSTEQFKQLITLEDLKVGQEVEIQYFFPVTPLFLATEIIVY
ncbi:hypothetical protein [Paenibacillus sp. IITD108]|uniref:hypothetical protein n=1 Tax=Paenibacillus sp. IITD108 TaxID=3116649 RepID=UPI002F401856